MNPSIYFNRKLVLNSMFLTYIIFIVFLFSNAGKYDIFFSILSPSVCILVSSHSNSKLRFYNVIRKSITKETETLLLKILLHRRVLEMTTTDGQTTLPTVQRQPRVSWDSNEEHYFRWASFNRRPMEPLPGR